MLARLVALVGLSALLALPAFAHKASDAYLTLDQRGQAIDLRVDLALRDVDLALGLDDDGDGAITWGEVRAQHEALARYVTARLTLAAGGDPCPLSVRHHAIERHTDGAYAVVSLSTRCASTSPVLAIDYRLLFDVDATHRALLRYAIDGGEARSIVLTEARPSTRLALDATRVEQATTYLAEGVHHILGGFDHLLFLVSLLLPAVLVRAGGRWRPAGSLRDVLADVARIVTAFTLAHSLTLALAVLGIVELPGRFVESAIALSVVLAALNNLWPIIQRGRVAFAFVFGLVHGFGFAGALGELGLPDEALALSLAAFNVGVELGQLGIAALLLPLAFAVRARAAYPRYVLVGGSLAIATVGALWLVERAFDTSLQPFLAWAASR